MKVVGGGPFCLGPGQITDDSELAMSLMWGIIKSNQKDKNQEEEKNEENKTPNLEENENIIDLDIICEQYKKWYQSRPFDIGMTTR